MLLFCRLRGGGGSKNNQAYFFLGRLGDPRVDWGGDDEINDDEELRSRSSSSSFSSSSSRGQRYPVMFAWKLLDAEIAAARGGRGVEAIFEAGAPRRTSTTTAEAAGAAGGLSLP